MSYERLLMRLVTIAPLACGAIVASAGALSLLGWVASIPGLVQLSPNVAAIKANAALAMLAIGLALLAVRHPSRGAWIFTVICCAVAESIGGITAFEYLGVIDWPWFDQLLAVDTTSVGTASPGRVSLITAIVLVLFGFALHGRRAKIPYAPYISQLLALLGGLAAFASLVGYVFDAGQLYRFERFSHMSPQSALIFTLASAGIVALPSDVFLSGLLRGNSAGGVVLRRMSPFLLMPLFFGVLGHDTGLALFTFWNLFVFPLFVWRERRLRESEAHFRNLIEAMPQVVLAHRRGKIVYANRSAAHALGFESANDMLGIGMLTLIHPDDRAEAKARMEAPDFTTFTAKSWRGMVDEHERTYVRKDGSTFPVRLSVTALRDPDGSINGYLGIASDISVQRVAKAELTLANEAAEAAMRGRTEFLARMSHELRTPINGVIGMLQLLGQTKLSREQQDCVTIAGNSAATLLALVNDVLDFSKIDVGKLQLESVVLSLSETLAPALRSLAASAESKGLVLLLRLPTGAHQHVMGDPLRLQQVIINLTANALKFTHRGEIEVSARVLAESEDEVTLAFSVADTGIGINEEKQKLIFEAFSQADERTSRVFGGTGLGLSISADLVRLMGGQLTVESKLGQGSTFAFALTMKKAPYERPERAPVDASVLIVSDNEKQRAILEDMARSWNMAVTSSTCAEAPAAYHPDTVDIVLFDGHLMTAAVLAKEARSLIYVSTAKPTDLPEELEFATHLAKPVVASTLLETIESVMSGKLHGPQGSANIRLHAQKSLDILLAEDNPTNTRVATGMLGKLGHRVICVDNGRAAVEVALHRRFDIVLMDVQMPEMDGLEAIGHIRRAQAGGAQRLPIIALTAQAMAGDRERCLAAGADDYLTKPLTLDALVAAIDGLFGGVVHERIVEPARGSASFDRDAFLKRMSDDEQLMKEVAALFIESVPKQRETLVQAVRKNDPNAIERAAHALVGSLANVAADSAYQLARRIEEHMRHGHKELPEVYVTALLSELDQLTSALKRLI